MAAGQDALTSMLTKSLAEFETAPAAPPAAPVAPVIPVPGSESPTPDPTLEAAPVVPAETPAEDPAIEIAEPETPEQLFSGGVLDPNSTRGQKIWSAYTLVRDLVKPESEGGIGHEPSVEDIRTYHSNHSTLNQMLTDFETQPDAFVRGMASVNPEAAAGMIAELPKVLDQLAAKNPVLAQAQEKLYTHINEETVAGLVDLAKGSTGDLQKFYFRLARDLKYFTSGGKVQLSDAVLNEPVDPLANERRQLQEREEALRQEETMRERRMFEGFRNELFQGLSSKLESGFEWPKTLEGEFWFPTVKSEALARVRKAVGDSYVARNELDAIMGTIRRQLRAGQSAQASAEQFQNTFLKYARPHIARARAEVLQKAGRQAKPAGAPNAVTPPAKTGVNPPSPSQTMPKKGADEPFEAFAVRHLNSVLGVQ